MTFVMPVSSSIERNMTRLAVPGALSGDDTAPRSYELTIPALAKKTHLHRASSWGTAPNGFRPRTRLLTIRSVKTGLAAPTLYNLWLRYSAVWMRPVFLRILTGSSQAAYLL